MKIEIEVPDEKIKQLASDIMQNFPECAVCLQCTLWKYDQGLFKFYDEEDGKEYTVTTKQVEEKLPQFIKKCFEGKYKFFSDTFGIFDADNWDAYPMDGIIQEVIFNDVIYG